MQRDRLLTQRIAVAVDSWPANSPYPLGHYVRSLGEAGTKDVETQVVLEQHSIPYEPFSASVLACLPPDDYKIAYTPDRTDLRRLPVLSIDPPNCKDIDDALHCVSLPNGNLQVGVHIADVTHYVKSGSAMDLEAANRSTSTYLVNQRLDMLPGLLTTDLCSLKSSVDRYAFSVLWEVTPRAEIVKVDFCKSMIHSIAALTYQQAQSMIEQPFDERDVQACAVKRLASLARQFRQRRIQAGALTLASPEVKFVLDSESLNPTDVQAYALLEANALVEEFMLLANVTVSKKILRHYPTLSVLRRHPSPNRAMFDGLISKAKCRGFQLDIEDSKRLADSLDASVDSSDPYINKLLRILSTRCMSPAQYFCSGEVKAQDWHHYGLAAPVYTHFTSPIRRYADICVHRLLAAAIGVAPLPCRFTKSYLHDLCANMNRRHRSAQLAGRASVQLHTLIFFAGEGAREEDAYVLDVSSTATDPFLTVMVPRYGIEGKVRLPIDDPDLGVFPDLHKIMYQHGTLSVQVFDRVRVRIWVREFEDKHRELVLDLVSPVNGAGGASQKRPRPSSPSDVGADNLKKTKTNS
jgi:exosome complex exonuclease DIS3/RRP44